MNVAEMRIFRRTSGVRREDRITNKYVRVASILVEKRENRL